MARTKRRFNAVKDKKTEADRETASTGVWRTGLYARLSVEDTSGRKDSIENQLHILRGYFQDKPDFLIVQEYVDKGFSGTNFHRPAFEQMMEDIRAGKVNCLATKDLSRLGRDYLETSNYVETIFPFLGVRYISVNDHFDTNEERNGNKEMEVALKNLVNDMYARDISKRLSVAKKQERLRGRFSGSNAPYGYKIDFNHPLRQLIVDEPAAEVVRSIYEMALEGIPLREISRKLQERRLRIPGSYLKTGELFLREEEETQKWNIGTISNILASQMYIGNLVQGKRKTRLYKGEKEHFTSKEEWIITENTHEPIVSRETYFEVRKMLEKKVESSDFTRDKTAEFPIKPDKYAGILYCGICGKRMSYWSVVKGSVQQKRIYYYHCRDNYTLGKEGNCRTSISENMLDSLVRQLLGDLLRSFSGETGEVVKISESQMQAALKKKEREIRKLKNAFENQKADSRTDYESYVLGELSREDYQKRRHEAELEQERHAERIRILENRRDQFAAEIRRKAEWLLALSGASGGSPDRDLLQLLITRIEIYPGHRLEITYPFSETEVFPDRKKEGGK